jgi:ligand-binding sensor domain-containing protein
LQFRIFNQKNTPALKSDLVLTVLEDSQGSLWAGTAGGGLACLRNGVFTNFTTKDGLSNDSVLSLFEDHAGALWIGTDGGGLNRFSKGRFSVYTTKDGLGDDAVFAITEDRKGNLWVGTHGGLSRLTGSGFAGYTVRNGLTNNYVRSLCPDRDGSLWIGTNGGGLSRLGDGQFRNYSTKDGLPSNAIWSIRQDANGSLWIGTAGGGVSRMSGGTFTDGAEFEKRAACIADEYSGFTAVDDIKLNGRLTLGENTADNGGLRIAYMALQDTLNGNTEKKDGFTPEQRFFLGWAQVWCENTAPQEARSRAITDPHSPGRYRVNGTLRNMPEFQKAYACKADRPMVSQNACRVW